jgi:hypothetical protein
MGKRGPKPRVNTTKKVEDKPNLFERMFNRKKFDVLGKKSKGQQRKIGQARSDAVERVSLNVGQLNAALEKYSIRHGPAV